MRIFISLILASLLAACATTAPPKPALYPNDKYSKNPAAADEAIGGCMYQAEAAGLKDNTEHQILKSTAGGALIGGAVGAAAGAVMGDAGRGAATGAVIGGAGGAAHGVGKQNEPGSIYKEFVNRCLAKKGYEVIGWR